MPDILIRNVKAEVVEQLKARAKRHHRSFQSEAKMVLESAAGASEKQVGEVLERWRKHFQGRGISGSAELIREDRER